jgi:hypothetical protein
MARDRRRPRGGLEGGVWGRRSWRAVEVEVEDAAERVAPRRALWRAAGGDPVVASRARDRRRRSGVAARQVGIATTSRLQPSPKLLPSSSIQRCPNLLPPPPIGPCRNRFSLDDASSAVQEDEQTRACGRKAEDLPRRRRKMRTDPRDERLRVKGLAKDDERKGPDTERI